MEAPSLLNQIKLLFPLLIQAREVCVMPDAEYMRHKCDVILSLSCVDVDLLLLFSVFRSDGGGGGVGLELVQDQGTPRFESYLLQRLPSRQSRGLRVNVLESSHGCLAAPVVSYCPSRLSELQQTVITKHSD